MSPDFGKLQNRNLPKSGDQTKPKPLSPYGSYRQPLGPAMLSTLADLAHALGARAFHLLDGVAEVIHALEILVHRCEADVGDVVHFLQLAHHHFADHAARDLPLAERQDALLDAGDGGIHVLRGHRPLVQRPHEADADFLAVVGGAVAVLLHDHRHLQVDALIGGEALSAILALAAAAHAVAVFRQARVDHAGVISLAVGAFHGLGTMRRERGAGSSTHRGPRLLLS